MGALIILATIMAIFGVLGYQRGTKASLFMAGVVVFGVALIIRLGDRFGTLINGLGYGIRFVFSGGLQALGGGGNKSEAISRVIASMGEVEPVVGRGGTGLGWVLVFAVLVLVGLLVSRARWFKDRALILGLVIGLINGYLTSAYLVRALTPEGESSLPLPLFLTGERAAGPAPAAASAASGAGLLDQISRLLTETLSDRALAIIIVVVIALFVLLATRFSNRPAKKG